MELVEATADDLEALADRWYDLARKMETYSELNEFDADLTAETTKGGFRAHLKDEDVTDFLVVHDSETIGFLTLREGCHPSRQYSPPSTS